MILHIKELERSNTKDEKFMMANISDINSEILTRQFEKSLLKIERTSAGYETGYKYQRAMKQVINISMIQVKRQDSFYRIVFKIFEIGGIFCEWGIR